MRLSFHRVAGATASALVQILDKAEVQGTAAVLVRLELGDGRVRRVRIVESNNTGALGSSTWLVLDLSLFHLSNGSEKLYKILVACRPRQLPDVSTISLHLYSIGVAFDSRCGHR